VLASLRAAAEECPGPHEVCADAARCGNKVALKAPGWVLIAHCIGKSEDAECSHCTGVDELRQCLGAGSQNNRHCTWDPDGQDCGEKYKGTCKYYLGVLLFCKKGDEEDGDCDDIAVCTGTAPN